MHRWWETAEGVLPSFPTPRYADRAVRVPVRLDYGSPKEGREPQVPRYLE